MSYTSGFLIFVINLIFGIYIMLVMLRLVLQMVHADFHNPLAQFVIRATNPLLVPLRRIIPSIGRLDTSSVLLLILLQSLELVLIGLVSYGVTPLPGFIFLMLGVLVKRFVWFFTITIIVQIAISWFNPAAAYHHPVGSIIVRINEPLLRPLRRLLPPQGGLDFAPILFIIIVWAAFFFIAGPLLDISGAPRMYY